MSPLVNQFYSRRVLGLIGEVAIMSACSLHVFGVISLRSSTLWKNFGYFCLSLRPLLSGNSYEVEVCTNHYSPSFYIG